jgi:uncharacterized protein (TIGR00730 family)
VYSASNAEVDAAFFAAAHALGSLIGRRGHSLVYGGAKVGVMGHLADAARATHAQVIGVIPERLHEQNIYDDRADKLIITPGISERRQQMLELGDVIVALPGGVGTFAELFDAITQKQLGYHDNPIVAINICGYFDCLRLLVDCIDTHRFGKPGLREVFQIVTNVDDALRVLGL